MYFKKLLKMFSGASGGRRQVDRTRAQSTGRSTDVHKNVHKPLPLGPVDRMDQPSSRVGPWSTDRLFALGTVDRAVDR